MSGNVSIITPLVESDMESAIIQLLLDSAPVVAMVGTRVYPVERPQGSVLPAIVCKRIDGGPEYANDGETGLENGRIQLDIYASIYTNAMAVKRVVRTALSGVRDVTVLGVDVKFITVVFERDTKEGGANQAEYLYRRQVDVEVWI